MNVKVNLGERSYEVAVGHGVRRQLSSLIHERAPAAQRAIVVAPDRLQREPWFDLQVGIAFDTLSVPDGEAAKTMSIIEELCLAFCERGLSRRDVIVAVGGGAVTDVVGFAASVYLRGVAVIHVPTSLVGQVDAAIGGKTAVNLPLGKNLAGTFYQPLGVLCDHDTLETLSPRDYRNGLGEVAKCWLLRGGTSEELRAAPPDASLLLAIQLKADIVSADEREGGRRALLNYGHTLAHALEAQQLSGVPLDLRHGEAVAIGLAFAARVAHRLGRVDGDVVINHDSVLDQWNLRRRLPPAADGDALLHAMARDKKAHHNLTFVLPGEKGFEVVPDVPADVVTGVINEMEREA